MLQSLDVLIAFTMVMLLASMAVTFLTQIAVEVLNTRGGKLREGLSALLAQANPEVREHAGEIARAVLLHPLIGNGKRMGGVVQREEFVEVLLELASPGAPPQGMERAAREALRGALAGAGDPEAALRALRGRAAQLEAEHPEWASYLRRGRALLETVPCGWVRDVAAWFDTTMDRVSHSFQRHVQQYTVAFSLVLALGLQLDAFGLLNRLALDESLRLTLVAETAEIDARLVAQAATDEGRRLARRVGDLREMASSPLVIPPERWMAEWNFWKLPGIVLSALLLSLGAPFWYDQLKNLLRLRPLLAANDDLDRHERRTTQAAAPAEGAERGLTHGLRIR